MPYMNIYIVHTIQSKLRHPPHTNKTVIGLVPTPYFNFSKQDKNGIFRDGETIALFFFSPLQTVFQKSPLETNTEREKIPGKLPGQTQPCLPPL